MEVASSTNNIYSNISTSQTSSTQNVNNSFDTYLNTQTQETTTKNIKNKIVDFLDAHNGFSSLSPTDEKIFRNILSDNKLTKEEADTLSYEQVERISTLLTLSNCSTEEEWKNAPIVQWGVDLTATTKTSNRQFNEAYYNASKELDSEKQHILESEVDNNLGQLYLGKKLEATFSYGDSYLANPWEYHNMNADFGKFIKDVISHHQSKIDNPIVNPVAKEQYQSIIDVYKVLEKNYEKIVNKPKYA